MIEVEKKFTLTEDDAARLTAGAAFLSERTFTDVYYDDNDYSLTLRDIWLRTRDGRWELKLPMHASAERMADQYEEIEDETAIANALFLAQKTGLADALSKVGYSSFCTCVTTRKKFKKGEFVIDLDCVEMDGFSYRLAEIELLVEHKEQINEAISKILVLADECGLKSIPVRGKVVEFLKRKSPDHYHKLVESGVIKDF